MTYEEAKMQIQDIPLKIWDQLSEPESEAMEMAYSALEKQIPKKPVMGYAFAEKTREVIKRTDPERAESKTDCCPACGRTLDGSHFVRMQTGLHRGAPYCKRCGQAIDWMKDNE
jgi:hypothetical protein